MSILYSKGECNGSSDKQYTKDILQSFASFFTQIAMEENVFKTKKISWVEFLCATFTKQSKPNEHSLKWIASRWIFNIPQLQRHFEYTAQRTLGAWRLNVLCFSPSFLRKVRNNRQLLVSRWQLYCMLKCFVIFVVINKVWRA